jgi:hypothetical protein
MIGRIRSNIPEGDPMAKDDPAAMTPVAAVVRHVEWLEFALAAARDEEARRRERLGRANDKNREKRTIRLAEVTAEVRELGALVQGLKNLQAGPAAASRSTGTRRRSKAPARKSTTRSKAAASARPAAAAAAAPMATASAKPRAKAAPKPKATASATPRAKAASSPRAATAAKRKATSAAKPRATAAAKPKTSQRARPKTTSAKPATSRTTKRAPQRRGAGPSSAS